MSFSKVTLQDIHRIESKLTFTMSDGLRYISFFTGWSRATLMSRRINRRLRDLGEYQYIDRSQGGITLRSFAVNMSHVHTVIAEITRSETVASDIERARTAAERAAKFWDAAEKPFTAKSTEVNKSPEKSI